MHESKSSSVSAAPVRATPSRLAVLNAERCKRWEKYQPPLTDDFEGRATSRTNVKVQWRIRYQVTVTSEFTGHPTLRCKLREP